MNQMRMFKLIEALDAGGCARAWLLSWNGERYAEEEGIIRVYDFMGESGERGERGYCFLSPESKRWEVLKVLSAMAQPFVA